MSEIMDAGFRRKMQLYGIEVVKDGAQPIPAKDLDVSLSECRAAGAKLYLAPRYIEGSSESDRCRIGMGFYVAFDTTVKYGGTEGRLSWRFNDVVPGPGSVTVENTEISTGIGVWTEERMREATEVK